MTKNLIDFEELLERTENDKDLMRDLLTIFKEEFPQRLQSLRDAEEWGYTSVVELLHEVDTALYAARAAGRNCVKVAAPRAQSDSVRELAPEPAWRRQ